MSVSVRPRPDSPRQCPFCRDEAGQDVAPCACGVSYHPECRAELSRCVTIGCAGKSAAPGQRGAHRDVACARCQGLINNDGDMCFGCWSPYHRRCLAGGCCRPNAASPLRVGADPTTRSRPIRAAPAGKLVWGLLVLIVLGAPSLFGGSVGQFVQLERHPNAPEPELVMATGRMVGALVGLGVGFVGLIWIVSVRERQEP